MDVIKLRTMTEKSVINFGKYSGCRVGDLLHHTTYLRWIYYNFEGLSFTPEVLDKIFIPDECRIKKPGIDLDMLEVVNNRNYKSKWVNHRLNAMAQEHRKRGKFKGEFVNFIKSDKTKFSKGNLQRINHGR